MEVFPAGGLDIHRDRARAPGQTEIAFIIGEWACEFRDGTHTMHLG